MALLVVSAFRCAYCYFLNPARKTRPQAPRLPELNAEPKMPVAEAPSSSSATSEQQQLDSGNEEKDIILLTMVNPG